LTQIRFLADEDLKRQIVSAVTRLQPKVIFPTVQSAGLSKAPDRKVLEYAHSRRLIVVTHDENTMIAEAKARITKSLGLTGLLVVPQKRPTKVVAEDLLLIWSASSLEEWADKIQFLPI